MASVVGENANMGEEDEGNCSLVADADEEDSAKGEGNGRSKVGKQWRNGTEPGKGWEDGRRRIEFGRDEGWDVLTMRGQNLGGAGLSLFRTTTRSTLGRFCH